MEVLWKPDGAKAPCSSGRVDLTVSWRYNTSTQTGNWNTLPNNGLIRTKTKRVTIQMGQDTVDDTESHPGQRYKAIHTVVNFGVGLPFTCCGVRNQGHAIIQFVRHRWQLGQQSGSDWWNLDVLDSQAQRAMARQAYDPTFTNQPNPINDPKAKSNDLITLTPGPGKMGMAVVRNDYPGLPQELYDRFRRHRGFFEWRFRSYLVCAVNPSTAVNYQAQGQVRAIVEYTIRMRFQVTNRAPLIEGGVAKTQWYKKCVDFRKLLAKNRAIGYAYSHPRPHRIAVKGKK